jgi:outer membrane protein TolC
MKQILKIIYLFLLLFSTAASGQAIQPGELTLDEYLGYVKKYHPLVKRANLEVSKAQASLMAARGAFDPKIEVDFDKKKFKDKEYYSLLNSSFKIPTWYGIEVKAAFDNSEGLYVNPQNITPNSGLTSLGVSVPVGQGLFINQRMADLRAARLQVQLGQAERKLRAAEVLYNAAVAYFNWKKAFDEAELYQNYLGAARERYSGVSGLIALGDKPAIDSVETGITVRNRQLGLMEASLKLTKARLEMENFLWVEDVPVALADGIFPEKALADSVKETLRTNSLAAATATDEHPKLQSLQNKLAILEVERRLKANMLLPRLDLSYNYLSEPSYIDNYRFEDYKIGVNFSFPLFLRKERGSLGLAKLKLQDTQLELDFERVRLNNKISAQQTEIESLTQQQAVIDRLVEDYTTMVRSEERLFSFGESSVFLINSRENSLISARLQQIANQNRYFISNAELFRTMANPD